MENPRAKEKAPTPLPPRARRGAWDCGIAIPNDHESALRASALGSSPQGWATLLSGPSSSQATAFCRKLQAELEYAGAGSTQAWQRPLRGRTAQALEEEGWALDWGPLSPHLLSQTQGSVEPESSKSKPGLPGHRGSFCVKVREENTFHLTVCELD